MKNLVLMMAMAGVAALGQAAEMPEALYLCGSMNEWTVPSDEAGRGFQLTDTDGDGVYNGSFELPAGALSFRVFDAPVGWESLDNSFGLWGGGELPLYSNRLWEYFLSPGAGPGNV